MTTNVKIVALTCATGIILAAFGYKAYSDSKQSELEVVACSHVDTSRAVLAVEKNLLEMSDTSFFNKRRITIGSILFHNEENNGKRIVVPFSLTGSRGMKEYQAEVKCSDFSDIEYSKS